MTIVWAGLVLLCLLMYVLLDGYDLGIGVATLFERDATRRREMLEHVAVAWDGNETWLVLFGVSLWAGFPLAYGTVLPHAYLPLIVMLFALIVRGVSVEMASQAPPAPRWIHAFGVASLVAALAQGVAVGTLAQRLTVVNGSFAGTPFGSLGWFSALTAVTVTCVYLALGYAWLRRKAVGTLRAVAGRRGIVATALVTALVAASLAAVNGTAAALNLHTPTRAIGFAGLLLFAIAGIVMALVALQPDSDNDSLAFAGLASAVVAVSAAVVVARAPVIVPPSLTVAEASSPSLTMDFLAVGIGLNVPLILFYNWFAHHSFRRVSRVTTRSVTASTPSPIVQNAS